MKKTIPPKELVNQGDFRPTKQYERFFESPYKHSRVSVVEPRTDECPLCQESKFMWQEVCGECFLEKEKKPRMCPNCSEQSVYWLNLKKEWKCLFCGFYEKD